MPPARFVQIQRVVGSVLSTKRLQNGKVIDHSVPHQATIELTIIMGKNVSHPMNRAPRNLRIGIFCLLRHAPSLFSDAKHAHKNTVGVHPALRRLVPKKRLALYAKRSDTFISLTHNAVHL